jgi:hypothetical protein
MESDRYNNVIPIRREGHEYINGTIRSLGEMSVQDLLGLEAECRAQLAEAQTDLQIVRDYMDRRFPDDAGPGSAA